MMERAEEEQKDSEKKNTDMGNGAKKINRNEQFEHSWMEIIRK